MSKGHSHSPWSVVTTLLSPTKRKKEKLKQHKQDLTETPPRSNRRLSLFNKSSTNNAPSLTFTEKKPPFSPVVDISPTPHEPPPEVLNSVQPAKDPSVHESESALPAENASVPSSSSTVPVPPHPGKDPIDIVTAPPPSDHSEEHQLRQQLHERDPSLEDHDREDTEEKDAASLTSEDTKTSSVTIEHQQDDHSGVLAEKQIQKDGDKVIPSPPAVADVSEAVVVSQLQPHDHDQITDAQIVHRDPEITAVHYETSSETKCHQDRLADTLAALAECERQNATLSQKSSHQADLIRSLETTVNAYQLEKSEARRAAENLSEELARDIERTKALDNDLTRQQDQLQQSESRLEDVQEELEQARAEAESLRADLVLHQNALRLSESRIENALKELVPLESKIQEKDKANRALAERVEQLEAIARRFESEQSETHATTSRLRSELGEAKKHAAARKDSIGELTIKMGKLEEEKSSALARHAEASVRWTSETESLRQNLKALGSDKADLMAGLKSSMERNRELENAAGRHAAEMRVKEMRIAEMQEKYATATGQLRAEFEKAVRTNDEVQAQVRREVEERRVLEKQVEELRTTQADVTKQPNQRQLERFERQNRMLVDQLRRQSEIIRRPREQLQQHDQQPPMPTTPALREDAEVVALVKKLNLEIFQTAAHMADSLSFTGAQSLPTHRTRGVVDRATLTMGRPMVLALTTIANQTEPDFNPLPVQFGLQACLVKCCERIVASWYPGHWEYGEFLATLYSRVQELGPKTASKWRSVTQAQLKQPIDGALQTAMRGFLQANLVDALIVAGWYDSQSAAQETFVSFRERLTQIVKLALKLNASVGVGDDWENLVVGSSELYEPEVMENAYDGEDWDDDDPEEGNGHGPNGVHLKRPRRVVCTTGLGLRGVNSGEIVIRPQVILGETLREETGYSAFD